MATTGHQLRSLRSLYPPEHAERIAEAEASDPYYLDDTLDAIGPSLLMGGPPPTPEEITAARAKALERGWLPGTHPADPECREESANGTGAPDAPTPAKPTAKKK
jgi:hypothetical protein